MGACKRFPIRASTHRVNFLRPNGWARPLSICCCLVCRNRKFTDNKKVSGASEEMHPLKELAEPEQVRAGPSEITHCHRDSGTVPLTVELVVLEQA